MKNNNYIFKRISFENNKFLNPIQNLFVGEDTKIYAFINAEDEDNHLRKSFDGAWTIKVVTSSGSFAIIYNDFKIFGGSFGTDNSQRMCHFLAELSSTNTPLITCLNTIGVRIMEGRKVFQSSFQVVPAFLKFAENNTLITANVGKCLGLGALIYAIGDYQMAMNPKAILNLTGPEVFKMFFGETVNFDETFNSEIIQDKTTMIHEIFESTAGMLDKAKMFLTNQMDPKHKDQTEDNVSKVLDTVCTSYTRVFPQSKCSVESYIATKDGKQFGVMINPLGKSNMIDVTTIEVYAASLKLFKKLQLPIISFVDTPGANPKKEQTNLDLISKLANLTADIIAYPYKKLGVCMDRCYGGASVLMLPNIYGGELSLALKGANVNIMGTQIIRHLLSSNKRMLEFYEDNSKNENNEHLTDIINSGLIKGVYELEDIEPEISAFLTDEAIQEESIIEQVTQPILNFGQQYINKLLANANTKKGMELSKLQ